MVQWYEYTGALGGSLWILLINVLLFSLTQVYKRITVITTTLLFVVPTLWSLYLGQTEDSCRKHSGLDVLIVQPNIDPYKKFEAGKERNQVDKFIKLCEEGVSKQTDLIIFPETALVGNFNEDRVGQNYGVREFRRFLRDHNVDAALVGASTHHFYKEGEKLPKYPRYYEPTNQYYDSYNTALFIPKSGEIDIYHKSRLVPGVESLPFPAFFKQFDAILSLDLGGVAGNLGRDDEAKSFHMNHVIYEMAIPYDTIGPDITDTVIVVEENVGIAPLICYESVFGEYVGDFVNKGATFLAVITNDGWWKNTPGHKQHMHYARLRAIEFRRYVVRSANTGISCVIDDNGRVLDQLGWWEEGSIRFKIPQLEYETYYAKHGDYLGKLGAFLFVFIGLSVVVKWKVRKSGLM
jgi:apolipoprotein N-acyltransferase